MIRVEVTFVLAVSIFNKRNIYINESIELQIVRCDDVILARVVSMSSYWRCDCTRLEMGVLAEVDFLVRLALTYLSAAKERVADFNFSLGTRIVGRCEVTRFDVVDINFVLNFVVSQSVHCDNVLSSLFCAILSWTFRMSADRLCISFSLSPIAVRLSLLAPAVFFTVCDAFLLTFTCKRLIKSGSKYYRHYEWIINVKIKQSKKNNVTLIKYLFRHKHSWWHWVGSKQSEFEKSETVDQTE